MKKLILITLLIASHSLFAASPNYIECVKKISKDFKSSDNKRLVLKSASIYAGYVKYGSISGQLEELAAILNIKICTKVKYKLFGRRVNFTYVGENVDVEQFGNIIVQSHERLN